MGTGTRARSQIFLLLPCLNELPWFGPMRSPSFIPATHQHRRCVEWRSRPAGTQVVKLARCFQAVLEGRELGGTLNRHGVRQAYQHRPSNDVADATSMCMIVLTNLTDDQILERVFALNQERA